MTAKSILIVDDEFGVVEVLETALCDQGYCVRSAFNGKQALARLAERRPDLLIMDFMMPIMNGRQLLSAMAANAELAQIPVILMSSVDEKAIGSLDLPYRAFLRKPFRLVAALEVVSTILG